MSTGENIKNARIKAKMTQAALAEKIGTTTQNISQYERDVRNPKIETLQKIAKALNVDWYELFVAENNDDLAKARTVKFYNSMGRSTEEALEWLKDTDKQADILHAIQDHIENLNDAGVIAAGQLILSVVMKRAGMKSGDPNDWMYTLISYSLSTSDEYEEVETGINTLLQIPAYKRHDKMWKPENKDIAKD